MAATRAESIVLPALVFLLPFEPRRPVLPVLGFQVTLPITKGALHLGPWQQVFYAEFDGRRRKRVVIKIIGE